MAYLLLFDSSPISLIECVIEREVERVRANDRVYQRPDDDYEQVLPNGNDSNEQYSLSTDSGETTTQSDMRPTGVVPFRLAPHIMRIQYSFNKFSMCWRSLV